MTKFLQSIGKEILLFIAGIIGFYIGFIADFAAVGFLAFMLLVIGGVFFNRHFVQKRKRTKARSS